MIGTITIDHFPNDTAAPDYSMHVLTIVFVLMVIWDILEHVCSRIVDQNVCLMDEDDVSISIVQHLQDCLWRRIAL